MTIAFADETGRRAEDRESGGYLCERPRDANYLPPDVFRQLLPNEDGELRQRVSSARNAIVKPCRGAAAARRVAVMTRRWFGRR